MNVIRTLADLQKALSVYDGGLPVQIVGPDNKALHLGTDLQIVQLSAPGKPDALQISLLRD